MDFFCDFQQILTFLTSQFLTLCTSIRKKSAKYILSCYLGYKIVDNLKKKILIWRGYPQCAWVLTSNMETPHPMISLMLVSHDFLLLREFQTFRSFPESK